MTLYQHKHSIKLFGAKTAIIAAIVLQNVLKLVFSLIVLLKVLALLRLIVHQEAITVQRQASIELFFARLDFLDHRVVQNVLSIVVNCIAVQQETVWRHLPEYRVVTPHHPNMAILLFGVRMGTMVSIVRQCAQRIVLRFIVLRMGIVWQLQLAHLRVMESLPRLMIEQDIVKMGFTASHVVRGAPNIVVSHIVVRVGIA